MNNNIILHKKLNLPHPPAHLVSHAMQVALDEQQSLPDFGHLYQSLGKTQVWFREIKDLDGTIVNGRPNIRFELNEEFNQWIKNNICSDHQGARVNIVYQTAQGGAKTVPIHTDLNRDWVLIYLLETSNTDQVTKFWREKDQPLIRGRKVFPTNWDNCELVDEVCLEVGQWYLLNTTVLHSIHNVTGDRRGRVSIHVDVASSDF